MTEDDQLIAGRYRLGPQVGSGAMGVVWRAEDELLRRTVALKQVRLPSEIDDQARDQAYRRVMREGRLFARLHHPNAIAVFDVVEHGDQPWLVMEYLPSRSLSEAVAARGVLSPVVAAGVGHQIAAALTAAHAAGIVHRDVKPGNVLLGDDGTVKVTDFGISRAVDETTITSAGMVAGTPAYLAPEVARGGTADFRSDVYALGSTLYAALEGVPPFGHGDNALAQLHRVASGEYDPPRRAGVLTSLLVRLLDDDPSRRPEMHQVRDELGRLAAVDAETEERHAPTGPGVVALSTVPDRGPSERPTDTVVSPVAAPEDPAGPRPRRGRLLAVGLGVLLVLVVAGVAVLLGTSGAGQGSATAAGAAPVTTDGGATATSAAGGGAGTPAPAAGTPDQVAEQQAVIDYYGLIPTDLAAGWQRLTPSYQRQTAGGFDAYSRFWGAIRQVTVRGVSPAGGDGVDATVAYVHQDGSTTTERTVFRMVAQDGGWKIDGSQVLSSR